MKLDNRAKKQIPAEQASYDHDAAAKCSAEGKPSKPFLKWAGGKSDLMSALLENMPVRYERYFEPFMGGASLFFNLNPRPKEAFLSDICAELVNCFKVVRDGLPELLGDLTTHRYDEEYFYQTRDLDRSPRFKDLSAVKRASRFIFLNKTCYNGLYRVNSRGEFNVPFGRYQNPKIFDEVSLTQCSSLLSGASIHCQSFDAILNTVQPGDFVYCDPPYDAVSKTSSFTAYSKEGFARSMQTTLRDFCAELDKRGVQFMVSNSYTTLTLGLYKDFTITKVQARRAINSNAQRRGKIFEIIVTNYGKSKRTAKV